VCRALREAETRYGTENEVGVEHLCGLGRVRLSWVRVRYVRFHYLQVG
jgi:hypothetical protein